eukprot:2918498-Pleurochrysis_carterae.AAC.1
MTTFVVRTHRADPRPPNQKSNTGRHRPRRARGSAERAHRFGATQMDHGNAKEMKKDARANVVWVPSP